MKILVALDDSPFAEKVLQAAVAMAREQAAVVTVLSVAPVLDEIDDMPPGFNDKLKEAASRVVDRAVSKAAAEGLSATGRVEQGQSPAGCITGLAAEIGADRIVIGHKGKSNLERLLVGSVALGVVTHAPCSVFVVK